MNGKHKLVGWLIGLGIAVSIDAHVPAEWQVNPGDFEHVMTVTAIATVNGVVTNNIENVVAAFVNGECRGVVSPMMVGSTAVYFLMVRANTQGETVNLRLYYAEKDTLLDFINTLSFSSLASIGDPQNPYTLQTTCSAISPEIGLKPSEFNLFQNYPNPFNGSTTIAFSLNKKTSTRLEVCDMIGKHVDVICDQSLDAGTYRFNWIPPDYLASGVYFFRLLTETGAIEKRTLFVK